MPRDPIPGLCRAPAAVLATLVAGFLAGCAMGSTPTGDNSRTALDWEGRYAGVVPCADCPGIDTRIALHRDGTFSLVRQYLDRGDRILEQSGQFTWNEQGSAIRLEGGGSSAESYLVAEGALIQLDRQGQRITGKLADRYVLRKLADPPAALLAPRRWQLRELRGQPIAAPSGRQAPYLRFERSGRVNGFSGCNTVAGTFEVAAEDRIRFSRMAVTMMACADMAQEAAFLDVLGTADSYYLDDAFLVLNRARMAPLVRLEAVEE